MAADKPRDNFFDTGHLRNDLKGRSVRGGAVTVVGQLVRFTLHTASTMCLARLLTPEDFGLVAMVAVASDFFNMFRDMGLSSATIQSGRLNHAQVSTLFWINLVIAAVIGLAMAASGPLLARFFDDPRLVMVAVALGLGGVLGGLTIQHQALLRRQMRFASLAIVDVVSMAVAIVVAITAALLGAGYWSLVLLSLVRAATNVVAVWIACRWRPGMPSRRSGVRGLLAFGWNLTCFNLLNYFSRNLDNMLIGRSWGPIALGLYAKAYSLLMLPLRQINSPLAAVAVPTLSRLQDDPERYRRYYCRAVNVIAFITVPLILTMAVLSDEIVALLLGSQWTGAGTIFKILAVAAVGQTFALTRGWVYVSLGQTKRFLHWAMISVPFVVGSFFVGLPWGPIGVALSYTVCGFLLLFPAYTFAFKYTPLKMRDLYESVRRPLAIGVIMLQAMVQTHTHVLGWGPLWTVLICSAVGALAFVSMLLLWPAGRAEAMCVVEYIKLLKKSAPADEQTQDSETPAEGT